jgi:hypothetical protein
MRRGDIIAYGIAIAATIGAKVTYDRGQQEQGALRERLRVEVAAAKALGRSVQRTDTVYLRDTVRLTRRLTRWDTVRAGVDTLRDTVRVPVETVRWITATADSTIRECRIVQLSCEARVAVRDSLLDVQRRQLAIMAKQRPGFVKRWGERVTWLAAGVVLGVTR